MLPLWGIMAEIDGLHEKTATCPRHPGAPAVATCARCGAFVCEADRAPLDGTTYCQSCVVLPEVDYLNALRLERWGKRDGGAWLVGMVGALYLLAAVLILTDTLAGRKWPGLPAIGYLVVCGALCLCFLMRLRWSRIALLAGALLQASVAIFATLIARNIPLSFILVPLVPAVVVALLLRDTQNKLFFRMEVPRRDLQKLWRVLRDNRLARIGLLAGVAGLAMPPLGLAALLFGIVGLRRVDPRARPPVGRRSHAIAAIALGAFELSALAFLYWAVVLR